jgi:hypothetical protein
VLNHSVVGDLSPKSRVGDVSGETSPTFETDNIFLANGTVSSSKTILVGL